MNIGLVKWVNQFESSLELFFVLLSAASLIQNYLSILGDWEDKR